MKMQQFYIKNNTTTSKSGFVFGILILFIMIDSVMFVSDSQFIILTF